MDKWLEEIRGKISCPQLGDEHYGEWGILTLNQRRTIKRMLDFIESQEAYINRLQAENERLSQTPKCLYAYDGETVEYCVEGPCSAEKLVETIKAEAYKEFAERLKEKHRRITDYDEAGFGCQIFIVEEDYIDNLLKEMTGE